MSSPKPGIELCYGCRQDRPAAANHLLAPLLNLLLLVLSVSVAMSTTGDKILDTALSKVSPHSPASTFALGVACLRNSLCCFFIFSRLERRACSPKSWRTLWRETSECGLVSCQLQAVIRPRPRPQDPPEQMSLLSVTQLQI